MFKEIFSFEVRSGFKRPATYLYFGVLFLFFFMIGIAVAGVLPTSRTDSNTTVNSAVAIANILNSMGGNIFSILVSVILIASVGVAIQKDYQYNSHALFFTKPVSKPGYFFGRLAGGLTLALFIFSGSLLGYLTGILNGIGNPAVGAFRFLNFAQPFLLFTVINTVLLGLVFFSLITFTRSTMAAYIFAVVLMVLQIVIVVLGANDEYKKAAAILDPLGVNALGYITRYWTPQEKNTQLLPLTGVLLYNRLLWLAIALVVGIVSYLKFSFSQFLQPFTWFRKKRLAVMEEKPVKLYDAIPVVTQQFEGKNQWRQLLYLAKFEFYRAVKNPFYIIIVLLCLGIIVLSLVLEDKFSPAPTYKVTYRMVSSVMNVCSSFGVIYLIFSSGTHIWRNKEARMDELVGTTPVSNSNLFFSSFMALCGAMLLLLLMAFLSGVFGQLYSGVYRIDLSQYFVAILIRFFEVIVIIGLCLSVQSYAPNKFLGFLFSLFPLLFLPIIFGLLEWNGDLYDFNSAGASKPYSDMNGFGGIFSVWPFYRLYWFAITGILILLAVLLYPRGKEKALKQRWYLSEQLRGQRFRGYTIVLVLVAVAAGGFIYYQNNVLIYNPSSKTSEKTIAAMEKKYKKYQWLRQPKIVAVNVNADIYPRTRELHVSGFYTLKNNTDVPIDTIYIDYPGGKKSPVTFSRLDFSSPARVIENSQDYGVRLFKLMQPLQPNDSVDLAFDFRYTPRGLFDRLNSVVVANGTFIHNSYLPTIGYNKGGELSQNAARKEHGLPPQPRMAAVNDSVARRNNDISRDADWIRFTTTVSTTEGQIAIAPGYLIKDWQKNGRHYFKYEMDSPILNFYSFLSAAYEVKKDKWRGVAIEVYYQKGHEFNIDRMIKSVKRSLEYYTTNFGPYQHRQVRILEFPRYASFAQSFPNTIPYSESMGFIQKVLPGPDKIDYPFYVTAHEVAHQWWGHQVTAADVQGNAVISETLSQYAALMVMEKEYGKDAMRKFLKDEMDGYLRGRTFDGKGEQPLMLCEGQQYIHYNKGSVVMYALKDFLGEAVLNQALRDFLQKNKFKGPLYTNTEELVSYIEGATPDSLKYLVSDLFKRITVYENYVTALDYKKQSNGSYKVKLTVGSAKFYADSVGKQRRVTVNDYMDIGIFAGRDTNGVYRPLVLQRVKMDRPLKTFEFIVKGKPVSAGIDPYLKLIDRTPDNNIVPFGTVPGKVDLDPNKSQLPFPMARKE